LAPGDINAPVVNGKTLLHICCESGHLEAVKKLIGRGAVIEARAQCYKTFYVGKLRIFVIS
jgi:ankyrin repeat protein